MAKTLAHSDLLRVFGGPAPLKVPQEEVEDNRNDSSNFKLSNKSLVAKNAALKAEITMLKKKLEELREENLQKENRIALLKSDMDQEKIDVLVAERFERKMAHMNAITERTILGLSKAAEEYRTVFLDMKSSVESKPLLQPSLPLPLQRKPSAPRPKSMNLAPKPTLDKVQESPLVINRRQTAVPAEEATTPKLNNITVRRTSRSGQKRDNSIVTTPKARVRSTPTRPLDQPMETETGRRKRAAASKIISFAEPSLHTKLRRPDKFDEPTPYISTSFF